MLLWLHEGAMINRRLQIVMALKMSDWLLSINRNDHKQKRGMHRIACLHAPVHLILKPYHVQKITALHTPKISSCKCLDMI